MFSPPVTTSRGVCPYVLPLGPSKSTPLSLLELPGGGQVQGVGCTRSLLQGARLPLRLVPQHTPQELGHFLGLVLEGTRLVRMCFVFQPKIVLSYMAIWTILLASISGYMNYAISPIRSGIKNTSETFVWQLCRVNLSNLVFAQFLTIQITWILVDQHSLKRPTDVLGATTNVCVVSQKLIARQFITDQKFHDLFDFLTDFCGDFSMVSYAPLFLSS
jgi:hypothetical protein